MTQSLRDFMNAHVSSQHATDVGTQMHARLARVVIDGANTRGDDELVSQIVANPKIAELFGPNSRTEVPIAQIINGHVVSRRIDRMTIDDAARRILILDYKTDVDNTARADKYTMQLREYASIMRRIYPDYVISTYILWTHDWKLAEIKS